MAGFYYVFVKPKSGKSSSDVEETLNLAPDWFRFSPHNYIVYTTSDADTWYRRLEKHVQPDGYVFVAKLDRTDTQGWMSKQFWDWMEDSR